jgi:ribose transport system permease protein
LLITGSKYIKAHEYEIQRRHCIYSMAAIRQIFQKIGKVLLTRREMSLFLIMAFLGLVLSIIKPTFATSYNMFNVARQISLLVITAIGETYVIISGGIDLSVGSMLALAGIVMSTAFAAGINTTVSIVFGLLIGITCGFINGYLITRIRIAPFIVTLGMLSIARGIVLVVTKGFAVTDISPFIAKVGQGYVGQVPIPVILMVVIAIIMAFILEQTMFGMRTKSIGGNEESTRVAGVNVSRMKLIIYMLSGFMAAIAGIVMVGRLNVGQPNAGLGWELQAIAAVIVGGTSLHGGQGTILGTVLGAALMGMISNILVLLGVSMYWQSIVVGLIIIGVVSIDSITHKK